jgi:tRNA pseudouridine38-40 synthase
VERARVPTYRLTIEYDGTDFCGWQRQAQGLRTVCGAVEAALGELFSERIAVTAAGRTDTGVHACGQVISFRSERVFPVERLALAMNVHLPHDVSTRDAAIVADGFSARHDALARTYDYLILNRPMPAAPLRRLTHHVWKRLDPERFAAAAAGLTGEHDFIAFCGVLPKHGGTVRTVHSVTLDFSGDLARIRIAGGGFLHRMVRISAGTLIEIATGRRAPDDILRILASRDRREAGYTAPACGLHLAGVRYADYDSTRPALGFAASRRSD